MKNKSKMTIITANLPEQYIKIIDQIAAAGHFSSRSEVIRHAVYEYIAYIAGDLLPTMFKRNEKRTKTAQYHEIVVIEGVPYKVRPTP